MQQEIWTFKRHWSQIRMRENNDEIVLSRLNHLLWTVKVQRFPNGQMNSVMSMSITSYQLRTSFSALKTGFLHIFVLTFHWFNCSILIIFLIKNKYNYNLKIESKLHPRTKRKIICTVNNIPVTFTFCTKERKPVNCFEQRINGTYIVNLKTGCNWKFTAAKSVE